jgi:hypothetical protein
MPHERPVAPSHDTAREESRAVYVSTASNPGHCHLCGRTIDVNASYEVIDFRDRRGRYEVSRHLADDPSCRPTRAGRAVIDVLARP